MRRSLFALAMLASSACRTHQVHDCFPACGSEDQLFFARCVAEGLPADPTTTPPSDACAAGNRRCCALAAECVGDLDDQTVVTTRPTCMDVPRSDCSRPCEPADATAFDTCVASGASMCGLGDLNCCAQAANCLGTLGDVSVSADGCCSSEADCPHGLMCSSETWTCVGQVVGCGDGMVGVGEDCDDGNAITESCTYGMMSCTVCDASCHHAAGAAHFCGDGVIDLSDGEQCDPTEAAICDASCHSLLPATCTNHVQDGTETDVDCGGRECAGCLAGQFCTSPRDCRSAHPECMGVADCAGMSCVDTTRCTDGNACTDDACAADGSCHSSTIDCDHDGAAPSFTGCGPDCNDNDANVHPGAAEICGDNMDQDCDDMIDEGCPAA